MSNDDQHCGHAESFCDECDRPAATKGACRELHQVAERYIRAAVASGEPAAVAGLIELLASMAVDLALRAVGSPLKAVLMIRDIIADRMEELAVGKGKEGPAAAPPPPAEKPVVH
jgi:hypothetical protein